MDFIIDDQTYNDLGILGNEVTEDIFSLFSGTNTPQGAGYVKYFMLHPTSSLEILTERKNTFSIFSGLKNKIVIDKTDADFLEHYLANKYEVLKVNLIDAARYYVRSKLVYFPEYYVITQGILTFFNMLRNLERALTEIENYDKPALLQDALQKIAFFSNNARVKPVIIDSSAKKLTFLQIAQFDNLLRSELRIQVRLFLDALYRIDAFNSIGLASKQRNFCFPTYIDTELPVVNIERMFHPKLDNPITNDFSTDNATIFFFTGANMSGKSIFFKSIGICLYLSHIGFPVPAKVMRTSIFNGLITIINLSDNLTQNQSHYFREVMRVKEVALNITRRRKIFAIFDELFKGTNAEDAFEATISTTLALSQYNDSIVAISTHIVSVANELLNNSKNIRFKCFKSNIYEDGVTFDYQVLDGISSEKLGMYFFDKAQIMEILRNGR